MPAPSPANRTLTRSGAASIAGPPIPVDGMAVQQGVPLPGDRAPGTRKATCTTWRVVAGRPEGIDVGSAAYGRCSWCAMRRWYDVRMTAGSAKRRVALIPA
ncbi:hypothetical protein GCM10010399_86690 [Dactylosporangium fulvum]